MYIKLVEALYAEHKINLIKVDDNKKLREWVGLCKTDREGKVVGWKPLWKAFGCSCVVVKNYSKESRLQMSSRSTSNARHEQKKLGFGFSSLGYLFIYFCKEGAIK